MATNVVLVLCLVVVVVVVVVVAAYVITTTDVTDRQTDRLTDMRSNDRTLCTASRGKSSRNRINMTFMPTAALLFTIKLRLNYCLFVVVCHA